MKSNRHARAGVLGLLGALALVAGCRPRYPDVPFTCEREDSECPRSYRCVSGLCVAPGRHVPQRLSITVEDREGGFSVHPRGDSALVCWNQDERARLPLLRAALLTSSAAVEAGPVTLYEGDPNSSAPVFSVHGSCTLRGDNVYFGVNSKSGNDAIVTQIFRMPLEQFAEQSMSGVQVAISTTRGLPNDRVARFTSATVGDQLWFMKGIFRTPGNDARKSIFAIVLEGADEGSDRELYKNHLDITLLPPWEVVSLVDLRPGDGGAWMTTIQADGESHFLWLTPAQIQDVLPERMQYIRQPVTQYRAALPLAVRGTELAVGYKLNDTDWQIYWITAPPGSADATARPGPTFSLPEGVLQPGGFARGDDLLLAAASSVTDVTVWRVPWGTEEPLACEARVNKLTQVMPRRLALMEVGGRLQAVWTERIPATNSGVTEYTALYADVVDAPCP